MNKNKFSSIFDNPLVRSLLMVIIATLSLSLVSWALNNPTGNPPTGSGNAIKVATGTPANTVFINASGYVGIGTTNPSLKLDVQGNIGVRAGNTLRLFRTDNGNYATLDFTNNKFQINTGGTFVMDTSGNVGISTTTPGYALDVNGSVRAVAFLYLSDQRAKQNINPLSGDIVEKVMSLRPVTFNWSSSSDVETGLIAQEVAGIFPGYVYTDAQGYQSIDYARLVVPLLYTVQQQQIQINQLLSEINKK